VAVMPSIDNNPADKLLISSPGFPGVSDDGTGLHSGRVTVWLTTDYTSGGYYSDDGVLSLPGYLPCPGGCAGTVCCRTFASPQPNRLDIYGMQPGDRLGYAGAAGQFNQDGVPDLLCGSPWASRNGFTENGIFYVVLMPQGGFIPSVVEDLPHVRITGTHNGDQFGKVQCEAGDMNGDSYPDVAFAAESWDDSLGADQGYVGVIFGHRLITGENGFSPQDVGKPQLAGVRFIGPSIGAHAGHSIAAAGDFNGDGYADILISAPGYSYSVGGQSYHGVAYLVFGGPQLIPGHTCNANSTSNIDNTFNLQLVGTPTLPGIVFYNRLAESPVPTDPADTNATIETVGGLGDVDGDGFDDIAIGAPEVDFVDPAAPNQRRVDAGEVYIIYGSNLASNALRCP
jgi:hypothetical protein